VGWIEDMICLQYWDTWGQRVGWGGSGNCQVSTVLGHHSGLGLQQGCSSWVIECNLPLSIELGLRLSVVWVVKNMLG